MLRELLLQTLLSIVPFTIAQVRSSDDFSKAAIDMVDKLRKEGWTNEDFEAFFDAVKAGGLVK